MFDYANLDRPDHQLRGRLGDLRLPRGVTFDLLAATPGPVATSEDELIEVFRSGRCEADREATGCAAAFRARFCMLDDGHAAERVVRRVLLGEPAEALPPVVPLGERVPAPAAARVPHH